jgi:hypothetical protein
VHSAAPEWQSTQWVAKFGRAADRMPVCRTESATMTLGKDSWPVLPIRIEKLLAQDVYLVERFQPNSGTQPVPTRHYQERLERNCQLRILKKASHLSGA